MTHRAAKPRRSMLIVPAGRERPVEKAFETDADILMFDLDDGVVFADDEKAAARARVVDALSRNHDSAKELVVRTNALDTPWWAEDIRAVAAEGPVAIVPAKVETPADIAAMDRLLLEECPPNNVRIWPMIESTGAVMRCERIAEASVRVGALCFGIGDFTVSAHGEFSDDYDHAMQPLSHMLGVARAFGLSAIAPAVVWSDVARLDIVRRQAEVLRRLGYDGAMVVTPRHLETVNAVFTPSPETVTWALKVEDAITEAHRTGQSAVVVDGRLVEIVNLKVAQQTLEIARALDLVAQASIAE